MESELSPQSKGDIDGTTETDWHGDGDDADDDGDWPSDVDDDAGWGGDDADAGDDADMMILPPLDMMPQLELLRQVSQEEEDEHIKEASDTGDLGEEKLPDGQVLPDEEPFITPDGSRDLAWHQEVDALAVILGDDVVRVPEDSDELIQRMQGEVTITIRPYCGELHLYEAIEVACTFKQTKDYPDTPPRFELADEKGLSSAEAFVLRNVMEERMRSLSMMRPGEPIIFDVVSDAQEFMAQKATFVTKKELSKEAIDAKRKAESERILKKHGKSAPQPVLANSPTVIIESWVSGDFLLKRLPQPAALVRQLEAASTDLTWTVKSVVSDFLRKRFLNATNSMKGSPTVAFHGTRSHNTSSIVAHGLLVPGVSSEKGKKRISIANGAAFGHGVYSSPQFSTAACYSNGSIFLCLVQLGRANTGQCGWMTASQGSEYDSNVFGSIYVLFKAEQVLPCLLLSYERAPGATGGGYIGSSYGSAPPPVNVSQTIVSFVPGANLNRKQLRRSKYRKN